MKKNPDAFKDAFLFAKEEYTAETISKMFTVSKWAQNGTQKFELEKKTWTHWEDFLLELEGN